VIGIECVSQPERVSSDPDPERQDPGIAEVELTRQEESGEAEQMQARHGRDHRRQCPPLTSGQR